jgi:hypothetical protein
LGLVGDSGEDLDGGAQRRPLSARRSTAS